jgi:hypothetical protein
MKFCAKADMEPTTLQTYFRAQQVPLQWMPFLRAIAGELSAQTDAVNLRHLFFSVGQRFAIDTPNLLREIATLSQLEEMLCAHWGQHQWGWVELREVGDAIEIVHKASPLAEAFGDDSLTWSVGFLEGFYQSIFGALGASENMNVRAMDDSRDGMVIRLNLSS